MKTLRERLQKRIHVSLYALLFLVTLLGLSVVLEGCTDTCEQTHEYVYFEPVYATVQDIRSQVALESPQSIDAVGKIYFKDGIMYVNDPGKGIHVINNQNPSSPAALSFLSVPGNFDLAIKGNTLYADSYVDLIAFDVSDLSNIREVSRLEGVFRNYQVMGLAIDETCCVITGFKERKDVTVSESACQQSSIQPWGGFSYQNGVAVTPSRAANFSSTAAIAPESGSDSGVGGSLARFTVSGEHLYLLDGGDLQSIDVQNEQSPVEKTRIAVGWDIETIFPYENNLFIGSRSGMHIFNITTPESPKKVSTYQHLTSCDPVVVQDNYAYVTLRSGSNCPRGVNQLQVIDISNLNSPQLVKTYPMSNPHGLGIDEKTLFICDGDAGLKAYDASDINAIDRNQLAHYKDINAVDVIPFNDVLMMIGEDGIFQYDYSDPKNIQLLSKIAVINE